MLFLYRPRQTWMPYRRPMAPTQQAAYNRRLQESYAATRRVAPPVPTPETTAPASSGDPVADLKNLAQLHASGALNDAEFAVAKAKVLEADGQTP
jgi:hypothetical protein